MKQVLFILLLSGFLSSSAQNYAPIGATWHYETAEANMNYISYGKWEAISDTTVLGKSCSKIVNSNNNASYIMDNEMYVYEDSGVVYQYIPASNSFTILYDFTAISGDYWTLTLSDTCSITVEVDSTEMTTINGIPFKVLYVTYDSLYPETIIERVGNINQPLPDEYFPCDGSVVDGTYYRGLRCYQDSVIGVVDSLPDSLFINFNYLFFKECDTVVVGLEELELENTFTTYPNPADNNITLSFTESTTGILYIRNTLGQLVAFELLKDKTRLELDLSTYTRGLYFIQLEADGKIITKKILKR